MRLFFSEKKAQDASSVADEFSRLKTAELIFLTALLMIKLLYFYIYVDIGLHSLTLLLESSALLFVAWLIYVAVKKRIPYGFTIGIYIFVSIVMLIDLTYYNYFGKIPSVFMLSNTGFVGDVGASVLKLLSFSSIVAVIDFPFLAVYKVFIRKRITDIKINIFFRFKRVLPIILVANLLFLGGDILISRFMLKDMQNEFLIFHAVDIGRYVFGVKENDETYNSTIKTDYAESDLHGIADGRNLIVLQVESLQGFVVGKSYNGKEITPNINNLISDGVYFPNYYYQTGGGNTSDAEFTVNNSLFAPEYESAYLKYPDNTYYGLPWILKENGFKTAVAFHAFKGDFWNREYAYENQGFNDFISKEDTDVLAEGDTIGLGMNDHDFLLQSLEHIKTLEQPFYSFVITLTSHHPYIMPFENRFDILEEDEGTTFADYLSSINYVDECIGEFIEGLKESGLYENCVIVLYGDHFAIPLNDTESAEALERFLGHEYNYEDFLRVPCIMAVPGASSENMEKLNASHTITGGHADVMPTVLDLFGYKSDNMIMFGQNLLSAESGIVYPQASLQRGSFVNDEIVFIFPQNGMLMNATAMKKSDLSYIDPESCVDEYEAALNAYSDSSYILDNNVISDILKYGREETLKNIEEKIKEYQDESHTSAKSEESSEVVTSNVNGEIAMIENVSYRTVFFSPKDLQGKHDGTESANGMLMLSSGNKQGVFISEPLYVGSFNTLIASWGLSGEDDLKNLSIEISVSYELSDGSYSGFYSYGVWSTRSGVSRSASYSDSNGQLDTDTLFPTQMSGSHIKLKIELNSNSDNCTSGLKYVAVTGDFESEIIMFELPNKAFIDVPTRSQMVVPTIGSRICSPTSLSMVLEYLGTDLPTETVAQGVYDNAAGIYGNWIFNTAYAASLGYNAYVDIYDMQALKYALSKGVPVICSVASSDASQLKGSPMAYPNGHLLVVCGYYTENGVDYLIVNDPAAPSADSVRRYYLADQFERVWNGTVYIIQ